MSGSTLSSSRDPAQHHKADAGSSGKAGRMGKRHFCRARSSTANVQRRCEARFLPRPSHCMLDELCTCGNDWEGGACHRWVWGQQAAATCSGRGHSICGTAISARQAYDLTLKLPNCPRPTPRVLPFFLPHPSPGSARPAATAAACAATCACARRISRKERECPAKWDSSARATSCRPGRDAGTQRGFGRLVGYYEQLQMRSHTQGV